MPTIEQLAADRAAQNEVYRIAAKKRDAAWPRIGGFTVCRGLANTCDTGHPATSNGWCDVCSKRIITLAINGYAIHPLPVLRVSYATYRAKTPQSAPKHGRTVSKPAPVQHDPPEPTQALPRTFADGVTVAFPSPEDVVKARAPVAPEAPAPMFGPGWAKAAIEGAASTDRPFGKWQALVDDGKRILEAPASPMEPDYHRLVTDAHDALNMAGDTTGGDPAERIRALMMHYRGTVNGLQDANDGLRANLRNPNFLRHALDHIEARAAEIATLKARLAELENE